MKTALITFFVFVTLNSCNAQSNNNVSKASVPDSNNNKSTNGPLLVTIRSNNSIKVITIKNRSNDNLWYYVSIELYDPGLKEWTNAVEDIDPKAGNWINLPLQITPKKDTIRSCDIKKRIPPALQVDTVDYRFKIHYGREPDKINEQIETGVFKLSDK